MLAHQCFATGGFGPDEQLLPRAAWRRKTDYTHNSFETQCGAFAVFKLCKYLMTITGDARYGDWIERLAFNGIAATIPMSPDGRVFYYSDYSALGGEKRNHPSAGRAAPAPARWLWPTSTTWSTSMTTDDLYINLFVPSTVDLGSVSGGPITIRQSHPLPRIRVDRAGHHCVSDPATFGLKLRVPGWLAGPLEFAVNGEPSTDRSMRTAGRCVRRQWKAGDRVSIRLPMKFDVRPLDDCGTVAGDDHARAGGDGRPLERAKPRAPCSASPT